MKGLKPIVSALLLCGIASPTLAQVCDPLDPPFLAEGPISAVIANLDLSGTITSMGIPITVPNTAPVTTPTAVLDMAIFADPTAFPGRAAGGFVDGTVIATGCVKLDPAGGTNHTYLADNVTSDVNENVLLGVVTATPTVDSTTGAVSLAVLGTPVDLLQDPRMPAEPLRNFFGFPVDPVTVPLLAAASVEGYFGDADNRLHAFLVEVDGGQLADPVNPQISIQRFRCTGDLQVQGGLFLGDPDGTAPAPACVFTNPPYSVRLFNAEADQEIPFAAGDLDVLNGDPLASPEFCTYDLRFEPPVCPTNVRIELLLNGVVIATASTTPDAPPPNTLPVAVADSYSTPQDTTLVIAAPGVLANDSDGDGDALTAALVTGPANGDLVFGPDAGPADGSFTYTPELGFRGTDTFTYQAVDSKTGLSNVATVTITVGDNAAPVAVDDAATVANRTAANNNQVTINVLGNDTDADGDALAVNTVAQPANGTATIVGNAIVYRPNIGFVGDDSFTYTARDALGAVSNTATVNVTVTNAGPTVANDTASTQSPNPVTISVLANDADPEGNTPLTVVSVTQPASGGTAVNNGTSITFTPAAGFAGTATFTYRAIDSLGAESANAATVSVQVTAPPAAGVDLDINRFTATAIQRVGRNVNFAVRVINRSTVNQPATATLIGTQNGATVYSETRAASDVPGGGDTAVAFPSFVPTQAGTVSWTLTLADGNPDIDSATATTNVRP